MYDDYKQYARGDTELYHCKVHKLEITGDCNKLKMNTINSKVTSKEPRQRSRASKPMEVKTEY